MKSINITAGYTDYYEITMGQAYYLGGDSETRACFDYFFRKIPFNGGYVIFSGLQNLLELLEDFRFSSEEIELFREKGLDKKYLEYLENFSFRGDIYSASEGIPIFPDMPILRVEANIIEAQIIETILLNIINFQSLIATKAARIVNAARGKILSDFGLRRAQGLGGYHASFAAMAGGFNSTSNTKAAVDLGLEVSGTMAHSFVQNQENELTAFRKYASAHPDNCVLLVDTYNTLKSGIPNAIKIAEELSEKGHSLKAIRLDSGDLAYQAKKARKMFDDAGFREVKIIASNQLDEYLIKSLLDQHAPVDAFGVGTRLITGEPDGALDGVYKLSESNGKSRMKLSENLSKMTLPGRKEVYRLLNDNDNIYGADLICLADQEIPSKMYHPSNREKSMDISCFKTERLFKKVMEQGKKLMQKKTASELADFTKQQLQKLPDEYKRFENPHVYKTGISPELMKLRDNLRKSLIS